MNFDIITPRTPETAEEYRVVCVREDGPNHTEQHCNINDALQLMRTCAAVNSTATLEIIPRSNGHPGSVQVTMTIEELEHIALWMAAHKGGARGSRSINNFISGAGVVIK